MTSGSYVEIALNLVAFQAPENATRIGILSFAQLRCFWELLPAFSHVSEDMPNVLVLFFCSHTVRTRLMQVLIGLLVSSPPFVQLVCPELPIGVMPRQKISCKNSIARSILHIDVQIFALHRNHNIKVYL